VLLKLGTWIAALWLRTISCLVRLAPWLAWAVVSVLFGVLTAITQTDMKNGRLQFHRTYGLYSPRNSSGNACQFIGRYGADGQPRTDLRSAVLGVVYAKPSLMI